MPTAQSGQWGLMLGRGILAIIFGLIALTYTSATALLLLIWFVLYAIADGLFHIYMSLAYRHDTDTWWLGLLSGALSVAVGGLVFVWPQLTAAALIIFIAVRAISDGALTVASAIKVGKQVKGEGLLLAGGLLAILFGMWLLFQPLAGGLAAVWIIGLYALAAGVILVIRALITRLRAPGVPN